MKMEQNVLLSFKCGRVFKHQGEDPTARINSISFHRTSDLLVSAADDDSIRLYNTQTGLEDRCGASFV
jgi:COMPASS component SWD2